MDNFFKRTWAEINLDAIRHNYTEIKQSLNPDTKICCVVKADGYGHGASFVAKELERIGAGMVCGFQFRGSNTASQKRH